MWYPTKSLFGDMHRLALYFSLNLDGKCLLSCAVEQLLGDPSFVTNAIEATEAQKGAMFVAVCMSW